MRKKNNPDMPVGLNLKERRTWRLERGLCTLCGLRPIACERSTRFCVDCLDQQSTYKRHQKDKRLAKKRSAKRLSYAERQERLELCVLHANALGVSYGTYMSRFGGGAFE